jgi:dethiobiotin synthetase
VLYAFELPACPYLAAREAGVELGFQSAVEWTRKKAEEYEVAVVEGAGGPMVPLTVDKTMLDFAEEVGYPVILVAANRLGCINHSLLSIRAIEERNLSIEALILNDIGPIDKGGMEEFNEEMISTFTSKLKIIRVKHCGTFAI